MQSQLMRRITVLVMAAAVLVGAGAFAAGAYLITPPTPVLAQESSAMAGTIPSAGTITVVGEGSIRVQPDVARASIGVDVLKGSVQEASAENRATVEAVLEALKAQGIEEKDIQTSGFSIYAERYGSDGLLSEEETRYRVSNNVSVIIRDLDSVGTVLDAAIEAGANNIFGVEFSLDDPSSIESEARAEAVTDAQTKAADLAELNGVSVGRVVRISEVIGQGGGLYGGNFADQARMMGMGGGGSTPVSPGEVELTMRLEITYLMGE